ncbi:hypothetical protein EAG_16035, partial [Camponotus floridanus]
DRALLLSHSTFHQKNLQLHINILMDNGFPLDFIFKHTHKRIKYLINNKLKINPKETQETTDITEEKKFITIPYIKGLSE